MFSSALRQAEDDDFKYSYMASAYLAKTLFEQYQIANVVNTPQFCYTKVLQSKILQVYDDDK